MAAITAAEGQVPAMPVNPTAQEAALELVEQEAVRIGVRKRDELDALRTRYSAADDEAKEGIWRDRLNAVRSVQRQQLVMAFENVNHTRNSLDMFTLPTRIDNAQPKRLFSPSEQQDCRAKLMIAVKRLLGLTFWPGTVPGQEPKLCAYHALIVAGGGPDQLVRFLNRTAEVRRAQQALFDNEDLCDTVDTGLLNIAHSEAQRFFSIYGTFKHHASTFFPESGFAGANDVDPLVVMAAAGSRRIGAQAPTKPAWGFGDVASRICCGRMLRLLEELAFHQPLPGGGDRPIVAMQSEFAGVLRVPDNPAVGPSPRSGDYFMEEYDGELAAEFMYMLWRIFTGQRGQGTPVGQAMPEFPKFVGPDSKYFDEPPGPEGPPAQPGDFDDEFIRRNQVPGAAAANPFAPRYAKTDFPLDAQQMQDDKQLKRAYIQRLVYYMVSSDWFLHTPAAVCMYTKFEQAATTRGFIRQFSSLPAGQAPAPLPGCRDILSLHRLHGVRIADGRMEEASRQLTQQALRQRQRGAMVPAPAIPNVGFFFRRQAWSDLHIRTMWTNCRALSITGIAGFVFIAGSGIYYGGIIAAAEKAIAGITYIVGGLSSSIAGGFQAVFRRVGLGAADQAYQWFIDLLPNGTVEFFVGARQAAGSAAQAAGDGVVAVARWGRDGAVQVYDTGGNLVQGVGVMLVQAGREGGQALSDGLEWATGLVRSENPEGDPIDVGDTPYMAPVGADVEAMNEMAFVGSALAPAQPGDISGLANVPMLAPAGAIPSFDDWQMQINTLRQDQAGWAAARDGFLNPDLGMLDDDMPSRLAQRARIALTLGSHLDVLAPPTLRNTNTVYKTEAPTSRRPRVIQTARAGRVVVVPDMQHTYGHDPVPVFMVSEI